MLRRLLLILTLASLVLLSACSGMSLDYYLARLAVKFNLPALDRRQPVTPLPMPSPTPLPTHWITLATPTP